MPHIDERFREASTNPEEAKSLLAQMEVGREQVKKEQRAQNETLNELRKETANIEKAENDHVEACQLRESELTEREAEISKGEKSLKEGVQRLERNTAVLNVQMKNFDELAAKTTAIIHKAWAEVNDAMDAAKRLKKKVNNLDG